MSSFPWKNGTGFFPTFSIFQRSYEYLDGVSFNDFNEFHDSYRVYVNGDYVGNKTLVAESERIHDLESHLCNAGYEEFHMDVSGSTINIITTNENTSQNIKENLKVYLRLR